MVVMTHKATVVATNITARINISPSFAAQHHFALQYSDCPNTFNKLESLFCGAKDVVESRPTEKGAPGVEAALPDRGRRRPRWLGG